MSFPPNKCHVITLKILQLSKSSWFWGKWLAALFGAMNASCFLLGITNKAFWEMEISKFSFEFCQQDNVLLWYDDTFNDEGTLCSLLPLFLLLNHCPTFPGQTNAFCCRYGKASSSFGRRGLLLCYGDTKMALVGKRASLPFTDIELLPRPPPHGTYIPSKKGGARRYKTGN